METEKLIISNGDIELLKFRLNQHIRDINHVYEQLDMYLDRLYNRGNTDKKLLFKLFKHEITTDVRFNDFGLQLIIKKWIEERGKNIESDEQPRPLLRTKYGIDDLKKIYEKSNIKYYLKCDLSTWLYWFGGVYTSAQKQIEWLHSIPDLLYLMECLCPEGFPKIGDRKIKELNKIFKLSNGKMVDSSNHATTNQSKRNSINKIFK